MSKVLLIGYNPPQLVRNAKIEAAHYRTWQFLQPLVDDGHTILLCAGARGEPAEVEPVPPEWSRHVRHLAIPFGEQNWIRHLQRAHDAFMPDCIVAVNFSHCLYATRLRTDCPLWMDIYGDMLTIMQASFYRTHSDRGLPTSLAYMQQVLQTGDVFSGCGEPQGHMLVGELAMSGRLSRRTFGYEFVRVVRPGMPPVMNGAGPASDRRACLAGRGIEDDDFVVLWCGGYNTWSDIDTLFQGLELAMSQVPKLHYVSVGASTYKGRDNVYERFSQMIERSPYHDRYLLLGWRPWHEMAGYYRASDVGINIDALHYETLYGTRTRLVEMIGHGLPIVTSLGSELSYLLDREAAALTFEVGDWEMLGARLVEFAKQPALRAETAQRANAFSANELSFYSTTAALRSWVNAPQRAPDKLPRTFGEAAQDLQYSARSQIRRLLWRVTGMES
ncbi:MAG: glycosyltransferase family 4 protein [Caldilineaceae bacterium]|nr:glycosyltransferase family 4 protein [Caldilineaceae bacterium]